MDGLVPGSASLLDCVDKKVLVTLRDGRKLVGTLGTYDQFANLILLDTVERIIVDDHTTQSSQQQDEASSKTTSNQHQQHSYSTSTNTPIPQETSSTSASRKKYSEVPIGLFLIRGENVVLLGEVDEQSDQKVFDSLEKIDEKVAKKLQKQELAAKKDLEQKKLLLLHDRGFCTDFIERENY